MILEEDSTSLPTGIAHGRWDDGGWIFMVVHCRMGTFTIQNRDVSFFNHSYDIVIGPVADAILDIELFKYRNEFGAHYLDEGPLKIFIDRVSQFGSSYIQYCFCTQRAMDILKKI